MSRSFLKDLPIAKVVDLTGRLTCVAALAWMGFIIAQAVSGLSNSTTVDSHAPTTEGVNSDANLQNVLSFESGYWSFAETRMSFSSSHCRDSELKDRMSEAMSGTALQDSGASDASQLIKFAKASGATRQRSDDGVVWSSASDQLRLKLLVSESEPPLLLSAALATKDSDQSGDQWQLTTLKTREQNSEKLLPFDSVAKISCTRSDEQGRPQMQIVSTSTSARQLLTLWKNNGWQIKHTDWGASDSFSFLCIKDDRVVYAWSASDFGPRTVMLTSAHHLKEPH
jgi:hypothetical protein